MRDGLKTCREPLRRYETWLSSHPSKNLGDEHLRALSPEGCLFTTRSQRADIIMTTSDARFAHSGEVASSTETGEVDKKR